MAIGDSVNGSERVRRIEQNHFRLHLILKTLIDVQTNGGFFVVLIDAFLNADGGITMLFYTFQCRAQSLEAKLQLLFVIVDPVIRTWTQKGVLTLKMRMPPEAQRGPPSHSQDK